MNDRKKIIRLILLYIPVILLLSYLTPKEINWYPSFSKDHNWPFGMKIMHETIADLLEIDSLDVARISIYEYLETEVANPSTYFFVNYSFGPGEYDQERLLDFVSKGNTAFISSREFSYSFLDTLDVETDFLYETESILENGMYMASYRSDFYDADITIDTGFLFNVESGVPYFNAVDTVADKLAIAWVKEEENPSFLKIRVGDGTIFLHGMPYLFTNYHLLEGNGSEYVEKVLSHLPDQPVIWDEHYKVANQLRNTSPLNIVLSKKPLRWAYWLVIAGLLLNIIFLAKRRQRIIPIVEPYKNESLDFTKTMGQLYFNNAPDHEIALKKIEILKEHLHSQYNMTDIRFSEEEKKYLADRTNLEPAFYDKLFEAVKRALNSNETSAGQLKVLNTTINTFFERKTK